MVHTCGACGGDGVCRNEHHSLVNNFNIFAAVIDPANPCPACGGTPESPGNCSVCGGTGEQDD